MKICGFSNDVDKKFKVILLVILQLTNADKVYLHHIWYVKFYLIFSSLVKKLEVSFTFKLFQIFMTALGQSVTNNFYLNKLLLLYQLS